MRSLSLFLALLTTIPLQAGSVASRIVWSEEKPHVEIVVDGEVPDLDIPAELFDAQGTRLWAGPIKVKRGESSPSITSFPLPNIKEPKKQHRLLLSIQHDAIGGDYREEIYFGQESAAVQTHGLRAIGVFPSRKVYLTLGLNGIKGTDAREIGVNVRIRDGEDNVVQTRLPTIRPSNEPRLQVLDVTPDVANVVGPFTLEASIESEAHQLFFNASLRFAKANALVPLSSFEHGDPALWFTSSPQHRPSYQTGQYYYSPHLTDLKRESSAAVAYDAKAKHSGRQALRIDYPAGRESDVWSTQVLPGKPLALWLWVEGNKSNDQLVVHFEDNSNFTLPAWQRFANFSNAVVCKLDFEGWRRFRVPVLGDGLQVASVKGSTEKIDSPIRILCFTVRSLADPKAPTKEARTVRLDDLSVETQASPTDMLSMELQSDEAQGRLTSDSHLSICVGNGLSSKLKMGRATITARDATQKVVWTKSVNLEVEGESFASVSVPLKELEEKKPRGPVDVDVTFQDATTPGMRVTKRLTLKVSSHAAILHDFEEPITFSGYQPSKVGKSTAKVVSGGVDGKGHALAFEVKPKQDDASVLFHPALPGFVDRVELMVKGGERPVVLQPWLIDSGYTGIWLKPYNLFWGEPITVDWQGWRKIVVPAPPVPAHFGDKNRYFLHRPWYPLHFAFALKAVDGETPVEIRVDDLRVVTHLPEEEALKAEIDYPEETRIHAPGSPLQLIVTNYAPSPAPLSLKYQLRSYQGFIARQGKVEVTIPAGAKSRVVLVPSLPAGIFELSVQDVGTQTLTGTVTALDAKRYFGEEPLEALVDPLRLRRQLGLMTEKVYLDWDNFEAAPYLHHYNWFEEEIKKVRALPILPKELTVVAAKDEEAKAAVTKADQALRMAQQAINGAMQVERQAMAKVEATEKLLPPAKVEEENLVKQLQTATTKTATLMKEDEDAKKKVMEAVKELMKQQEVQGLALKVLMVSEQQEKTAQQKFKEVEGKRTAVMAALMAVEKEATAAEAAVKKAEQDPKQKDQLPALQLKATMLKKKVEELRLADEQEKKQLAEAKLLVEEASKVVVNQRKEVETGKVRVAAAMQGKLQAEQKVPPAQRNLDQAKREQMGVEQKLTAAKQRLANLMKMLETDRVNHVEKVKAALAAREAIEKGEVELEQARIAGALAAKALDEAKNPYALKPTPIVGFCAEWAGPESREAMEKGTYTRWIPNRLQLPRRLIDWSEFLRAGQREYKGRFDTWTFWENPDLEESPQSIPPNLYRPMLEPFARWVRLYSPEAKIIAGGFNFPRAVEYLQKVKDAHTLPFDEIAVQMNLGELSPEHADLEGFLDELNDVLKIRETKRIVRPTELDWSIGKHLSPMQQAAYHARATLILDSRGVPAHQLSLINTGFDFDGFGVFYRVGYGSSPEVQTFKPYHVPKPSYFALMETRRFLGEWKFVNSVNPPDRSLSDNRAFIYRNSAGKLTAILWRSVEGERVYKLPATWKNAKGRDVFGFEASLEKGLRVTALPTLIEMVDGTTVEQLQRELRTLEPEDGRYPVVLDLHSAEEKAGYETTGTITKTVRGGAILGERKTRETYLDGLLTERFAFDLREAGNALLKRRWFFDGQGGKVLVKLNGGEEQTWDLSKGQDNTPGLRETTVVLHGCKAGKNVLTIRHERASNGAGWRIEPMPSDHLSLDRLGMLNGRQTKGEIVKHASASGTPLTLEKKTYETGIGTHATSFIEYPLAKQFSAFEVTVGIDANTEGRGSVVFRVFVDGKERATSGVVNGFTKPKTLKVDNLEGAERMILSVTDAGDGNRDDLANWVDGKLWLKR